MKSYRVWTVGLLLTLAACSSEPTGLERIESIRVTPADPTIQLGLTIQFTAEALDAQGTVIPGVDFTWSSSNTSVATVDHNGLVQSRDLGTTAITASAGAATPGSQALTVEPNECDTPVDVILDPGQHQSYDATTCLFLPSGSSGDRYRIAITRPTIIGDPQDTTSVWLEINPILTAEQAAGEAPTGPSLVAPATYTTPAVTFEDSGRIDGRRFLRDKRIMDRTRRFHLELRQRERDLGLLSGAAVARPEPALAPAPTLVDPPTTERFFLGIDCSDTSETPVRLVDFNDHVAIYQDSASYADPDSRIQVTDTEPMLSYHASYVADFADAYWGQTPDIDGNGRIIVSTAPALADSVAAAVFSGDLREPSICQASNEAEIVYFSEQVIQNVDAAEQDQSYLALSVLAHEQKHVVSLYNGIARGAFHDIWIEEGTAEVAQTKTSRIAWAAVGGPPLGTVLTGQDIVEWNDANNGIGPEAWGIILELADLVTWGVTQPNSYITNPAGADEFHTFYAGGWHWHRFLGDAFGGASTPLADSALFREMNDSSTAAGTGALIAVTGRTFDELFEDVTVAASFHDAGPTPARAFTTWDLSSATAIFRSPAELAPPHMYPWPVTTDAEGNVTRTFSRGVYSCPPRLESGTWVVADPSDRCAMGPAGTRLHDFVSDGTGEGAQVQVFGASNGRLVVTRIN